MKTPKIIISYSKFLNPIFIFYCKNNPDLKKLGWNDWVPPTEEEIQKRVKNYREVGKEIEKKFITALCKETGLEFQRNIIDIYVVAGNPRQFSHPLVIKSGFSDNDFISNVAHELIHLLFSDNRDVLPQDFFTSMFPGETRLTANHVVVHALLNYLFTDVFKKVELLNHNKTMSEKHSTKDYTRAWEIVDKFGYPKILSDFRERVLRSKIKNPSTI